MGEVDATWDGERATINAGKLMFAGIAYESDDTPGKFHCQVMYRDGYELAAYVEEGRIGLIQMLQSMVDGVQAIDIDAEKEGGIEWQRLMAASRYSTWGAPGAAGRVNGRPSKRTSPKRRPHWSATACLKTMPDVDLTPEQQDDVVRLMRMIDAASERQDRLVGEVLVSVPDGWLIPDAPECHVDHVREDRYGEVIAALQEARADTSKN